MPTETNQTKEILRDLCSAFLDHPDALEIEAQEAPGSCFWQIRGHREDESKLVGRDGSHVRALAFLVGRFGAARSEAHTFKLLTERRPEPRPPLKPKKAIRYDTKPVEGLLVRILSELDLGDFFVTVGPGTGARDVLTFVFSIVVKDPLDVRILTVRPDPNSDETIVGAIGTLFRAIAKKNGVRFDLAVLER